MGNVVRDWTKWIVPRVNENTKPNGEIGDKTFRTTDVISLKSFDEVRKQIKMKLKVNE